MRNVFSSLVLTIALVAACGVGAAGTEFEFTGRLPDLRSTNRDLTFLLFGADASGQPLWGRTINVATDGDGEFKVLLADTSGKAVDGAAEATLQAALQRAGSGALQLVVRDGSGGSFSVSLPTEQVAGVADEVVCAPGDFHAEKGVDVTGSLKGADFSAARFGATSLSSRSDVKIPYEAHVSGGLAVSGTTRATGPVTVRETATVSGSAAVATEVQASGDMDAGALSGVTALSANASLTAGGAVVGAPVGTIIAWPNETPPPGWKICNGVDAQPDLRARFVVGAGRRYALNAFGGEGEVTLTPGQMARHSHGLSYYLVRYDADLISDQEQRGILSQYPERADYLDAAGTRDVSPHNNLPPYYALVYIIKIGGAK